MKTLLITTGLLDRIGESNSYQEALIASLVDRGHAVSVICTAEVSAKPWLHFERTTGNPAVYSIFNAGIYPARYPGGGVGTRTPLRDIQATPSFAKLFWKILGEIQPDVVNIQSLFGLPFDLVAELGAREWPVVFTAHDFFALCPTAHLYLPDNQRCRLSAQQLVCGQCCAYTQAYGAFQVAQIATEVIKFCPQWCGAAAKLLLRLRNAAVRCINFLYSRETLSVEYAIRREQALATLRSVKTLHCISKNQAKVFAAFAGPLDNLRVLPLQSPAVTSKTAIRKKKPGNGPLKLGALNTAVVMKGGTWLLERCKSLEALGLSHEVHFYGNPIQCSGSAANVHHHGRYRSGDLDAIAEQLDFCVVPSVCDETLAFTGLEMLARGVPLIASSYAGVSSFVKHGVDGFVFDPADPARFEQLVTDLAGNRQTVAEIQAACAARRVKSFEEHITDMEQLFRDTCGFKGA